MSEKEKTQDESIRIGVIVCHCGSNIGGVLNCKTLAEFAKTLSDVVYSDDNSYLCSESGLACIKNAIKENNLNRLVIAGCTPRTHERLFQNTIREAGINPYLFILVNILYQCSWAHLSEPQKAMDKAKELIAKNVSKVKFLEPIYETTVDINHSALIIGGGIAGITVALSLAKQGFESYIVEREKELGGLVKNIHYVLGPGNPQEYLKSLIEQVKNHNRIKIYTDARIEEINGFIGNFSTLINHKNLNKELDSGVIIVATGGREYKPEEYLYGKDERIITQLELEQKIVTGQLKGKTIAMIQCVGSRNEERPICSRICCAEAIKNALKLKKINPKLNICILHRDIHTYGFKEDYYKKAREKGVIFVRFDEDFEPKVDIKANKLTIAVNDVLLNERVVLETDLIVLSSAFLPSENKELSKLLKVPLDENGFFLEAHVKYRPLEFASEGIFLCGAAQWPKFIDETIAQALGASSRASTILSKDKLSIIGSIAEIDEDMCIGCGNCRDLCAYNAIEIGDRKSEYKANGVMEQSQAELIWYKSKVHSAMCKGCGRCIEVCPVGALTLRHFSFQHLTDVSQSFKYQEK
ncbi:MAG: CoB--CoM heterodisulfide reductase iron-sulfur subunit A family protein [Promethearchaeota archaeon]